MSRLVGPMLLLALLSSATACHHHGWRRSSRRVGKLAVGSLAAAPATTANEVRPAPRATTPPAFSAPIAATRASYGTVVAGFVVKDSVVRVTALKDDGTSWSVDAVRDVTWAADAEVKLEAAGDTVVLLWRSGNAEHHAGTLVVLGQDGAVRGAPQEVGVAECATDDGLAWIEPRSSGPYRVRGRSWTDGSANDRMSVLAERTPTLVCDERSVFVLGDGEDDLTAARIDGRGAATAQAVIRASDFPDDEVEHDAFAVDGKLELLRIANSGALAEREIPVEGPLPPWRKLRHRLSDDDDVIAVDGDSKVTVIVYTQEAEGACPASASPALRARALRVDRSAASESTVELAAPSCDHAPGALWIDTPRDAAPIVAWVERASQTKTGSPPIRALAYRVLGDAAATSVAGRIPVDAEDVVDAGCYQARCTAAALLAPADGDATKPMSIAVFDVP